MASVYALRLLIRSMHNRVGLRVQSRELSVPDLAVLVPVLAVIGLLSVYPQLALHRSEGSVKRAVASVRAHPPAALRYGASAACSSVAAPRAEGPRCRAVVSERRQ
jgi:NADH:ubiquinone oxidoreductase subunit 4 (subunit M)